MRYVCHIMAKVDNNVHKYIYTTCNSEIIKDKKHSKKNCSRLIWNKLT